MCVLIQPDFMVEHRKTSLLICIAQLVGLGSHFGWIALGIANMIQASECYKENLGIWNLAFASVFVLFTSMLKNLGILWYSLS